MRRASRIYVTGAPCAGVSTLGRQLARKLELPCIDIDDLHPASHALTIAGIVRKWVLNGPAEGWADDILREADHVIFLITGTALRLARLIERDRALYGQAIEAGGRLRERHLADWTSALRYDDPTFAGTNRLRQERWLLQQSCPIHRLDGGLPLADLLERAVACVSGSGR